MEEGCNLPKTSGVSNPATPNAKKNGKIPCSQARDPALIAGGHLGPCALLKDEENCKALC